jgi:hypothetical protein
MTLFALNIYRPAADHCGQVCSTLLYLGVPSSNLLCGFSHSLQANAAIIPHFSPQPLPSISVSFHYSLTILPFSSVYSDLPTALPKSERPSGGLLWLLLLSHLKV